MLSAPPRETQNAVSLSAGCLIGSQFLPWQNARPQLGGGVTNTNPLHYRCLPIRLTVQENGNLMEAFITDEAVLGAPPPRSGAPLRGRWGSGGLCGSTRPLSCFGYGSVPCGAWEGASIQQSCTSQCFLCKLFEVKVTLCALPLRALVRQSCCSASSVNSSRLKLHPAVSFRGCFESSKSWTR